MKNKDIEQLIERYMDGQTTLAEEQRLAEALRASGDPQWDDYRRMFDFIEDGCPAKHPRRKWTRLMRWVATGAAAAVVAGMFLVPTPTETQPPMPIVAETPETVTSEQSSTDIRQEETGTDEAASPAVPTIRRKAPLVAQETAEAATDSDTTEEIDLSRYVAMVVETEPEAQTTEQPEMDEEELINRCIDLQLQLMERRTRDIERIATAMQRRDEAALEMLTREL